MNSKRVFMLLPVFLLFHSFVYASGTCEYKYPDGSRCINAVGANGHFCDQHLYELNSAYLELYSTLEQMKEEEERSASKNSNSSKPKSNNSSTGSSKKTITYSGKCFSEADGMPTPDGVIDEISYVSKETNESAIIYFYSLGSSNTANSNWKKYQSVLANQCGFTFDTDINGATYVYNGNKLISVIGIGNDVAYGGYYLAISFSAKNITPTKTEESAEEKKYKKAQKLFESGKYLDAAKAFEDLGEYSDATDRVKECYTKQEEYYKSEYEKAVQLYKNDNYEEAIKILNSIKSYPETDALLKDVKYDYADQLDREGKTGDAAIAFYGLGDYKDSMIRCDELWNQIVSHDYLTTGSMSVCAITKDLRVVAAGENGMGRCNVSGFHDIVDLAANNYNTFGLNADGTVVAVGYGADTLSKVSKWTDVVSLYADYDNMMFGVRKDGTVLATVDKCKSATSGWKNIIDVTCGWNHVVGLKTDGSVVSATWDLLSSDNKGQANVNSWKNIVKIVGRMQGTVALDNVGKVYVAGNLNGISINVSSWSRIKDISVSDHHILGLREDGTVVADGLNNYGQCDVQGWRDIIKVAAGDGFSCGLKRDGTVITAGRNNSGQCEVTDWTNIVDIVALSNATVGITADGQAKSTDKEFKLASVNSWKNINIPLDLLDGKGQSISEADNTVNIDTLESVDISRVQTLLNEKGFNCGSPDGIFGPKTNEAIKQYQNQNGLQVNGEITNELLNSLGYSK